VTEYKQDEKLQALFCLQEANRLLILFSVSTIAIPFRIKAPLYFDIQWLF
jgi:hypothetical protein